MPYIPLLFGRFLVKAGWVSEEQVEQALALQKELTPSFGLVAVLENMLTMDELHRILMHQRRLGLFFKEAVTQLGLLDDARLAGLEECRRSYTLRLGEALVVRGDLTDMELREALSAFEHYKSSRELIPRPAIRGTQERDTHHESSPPAIPPPVGVAASARHLV
jgi:hypothetical protein